MLKEMLLSVLLGHSYPGYTKFSLEPATDCAPAAETCPDARRSAFWGGWARKESAETGRARYQVAANAMVDAASSLLCIDDEGKPIENCAPMPEALGAKGKRRWRIGELVTLTAAVGLIESGYREDVANGRGQSGHPSDDGGEGRGPAMEACYLQIHPSVAWRFADSEPAVRARAANFRSPELLEEVAKTLVGSSPEALGVCFRTGMRMLIHARAYCAWAAPTQKDWQFATLALYGTGDSCTSLNKGKTLIRRGVYDTLSQRMRALQRRKST